MTQRLLFLSLFLCTNLLSSVPVEETPDDFSVPNQELEISAEPEESTPQGTIRPYVAMTEEQFRAEAEAYHAERARESEERFAPIDERKVWKQQISMVCTLGFQTLLYVISYGILRSLELDQKKFSGSFYTSGDLEYWKGLSLGYCLGISVAESFLMIVNTSLRGPAIRRKGKHTLITCFALLGQGACLINFFNVTTASKRHYETYFTDPLLFNAFLALSGTASILSIPYVLCHTYMFCELLV